MACSIDICPGLNESFNSRAGCRKPPLDLDHQDSLTGAYRWTVLPFRAHRGAAAFSSQYLAGCMRAVGLGGSIRSGSCTTAHLDPSRGAEQTGVNSVVQDISHRLSRAKKLFVHQSEQSFVAGAQVGLAKTRRAWNGSCAGTFQD